MGIQREVRETIRDCAAVASAMNTYKGSGDEFRSDVASALVHVSKALVLIAEQLQELQRDQAATEAEAARKCIREGGPS